MLNRALVQFRVKPNSVTADVSIDPDLWFSEISYCGMIGLDSGAWGCLKERLWTSPAPLCVDRTTSSHEINALDARRSSLARRRYAMLQGSVRAAVKGGPKARLVCNRAHLISNFGVCENHSSANGACTVTCKVSWTTIIGAGRTWDWRRTLRSLARSNRRTWGAWLRSLKSADSIIVTSAAPHNDIFGAHRSALLRSPHGRPPGSRS